MRLLMLACSATKRHDAGLLPAIDRYDGPSFRTLRRSLTDNPARRSTLDLLILSAEFGLIYGDTPIPDYDRRMDAARASELCPSVAQVLASHLTSHTYRAMFVSLGADYAAALTIAGDLRPQLGAITSASGGIGTRLGQLRRWLITGP